MKWFLYRIWLWLTDYVYKTFGWEYINDWIKQPRDTKVESK